MEEHNGAVPDSERRLKVNYVKSNFYRIVHADGIYGGVTPRGHINMGIWSERQPIPREATYLIQDGQLGDEVKELRVGKTGSLREMEVGIMFDLPLAKAVIEWLQSKVEQVEGLLAEKAQEEKGGGE